MRIVHAADLHIDSPLRGLGRLEGAPVDEIRLATRAAFVALIDLCRAQSAALLLLAGDVFDGEWRDFNTGLFFVRELARLRDVGTRVVMLRGNHDAESALCRHIPLPEHVRVLAADAPETVVYEDLGVAVHGQSYAARVIEDNLAERYPAPRRGLLNIGVLHTNAVGSSEHKNYAPCTVGQLVRHGYDYWALGHVHRREVLHERPWVVYPGNLQGRHARETGAKGATLLEVEDQRITSVAHVDVDVLRWVELSVAIGEGEGLDSALDRLRASMVAALADAGGRPVVARITLTGQTRLHARLIAHPEPVRAQIRAIALDVGELWPEKIKFATAPAPSAASARELVALRRALRAELARLAEDDAGLAAHLEGLAGVAGMVAQHLQPEQRPDNLEAARARLPAVEALLLGALDGVAGELAP
ncbi:MAG: DNA repair exonuclease [Nannocystaceae bacterium]